VYNVLYSEIALSREPFGIGHMYIYIFLLRMTDTRPPLILTFPPGTLCIASNGRNDEKFSKVVVVA
jgi:hypothetical protein